MIYFIAPVDGVGPVKIGHSGDVEARRQQLEWRYGRELAVLATMPGGREEEAEIHGRFAHLRFKGRGRRGCLPEQFRPAAELMAFIGRPLLVSPNPDAVELMDSSTDLKSVRIELAADQLAEVRAVAKSIGLPLSTFVRLAVLEKVRKVKEGKS